MSEIRSFCRVCAVNCAMIVTIEEGRVRDVRGDKENLVSNGYACSKGLLAPDVHNSSDRLLHPLKRQPDGSFTRISSDQALDEIAERLNVILDRDGPEAIALFLGGAGMMATATMPMGPAFVSALGTSHYYSPATLDQPSKGIVIGRLGKWIPGPHDMDQADVVLLFGANPVVSQQSINLLINDPVRKLKAARRRGMRLIGVDPRRTETTTHADLHLQPYPGEDPAILAGLIRIIIAEGWYDDEICTRYVGSEGMKALWRAVEPFTPDMVERRAGLESGQLTQCARLFAQENSRGPAVMTTGGNFSPFANLSQHLVETINIICGRLRRPGDRIWIDMFAPPGPIRAEVQPPDRPWEREPMSRIRGIGNFYGQKLAPTLAEEVMRPGQGRVRALISSGGNPVAVIPDQRRMVQAMNDLELSVTIDPSMSATARLSDYVMAPKVGYERSDFIFNYPGVLFQDSSYARYTPAIVEPPAGSDLIDDWFFFWAIASRLGLQINYHGTPVDMKVAPTTDALLSIRARQARVTLEELRTYPQGKVFDDHPDAIVAPGRPGMDGQFDVMPVDVAQEIRDYLDCDRAQAPDAGNYPYLLCNRRSRHVFNSTLSSLATISKRSPFGIAYINPSDLARSGVAEEEEIVIESRHGRIAAVAKADPTMKPGVISMVHAADQFEEGDRLSTNVNALIDAEAGSSTINALPVMSAIPVRLMSAVSL